MAANSSASARGILLLRCIRAYVELDLLASFDVHTDRTIQWIKVVLNRFAKFAEVRYLVFSPTQLLLIPLNQEYDPGQWNFPKMHLAQHLSNDIVEKGVTRNYSTKTFEKMHGPLKESYLRRTNFKNVGGQVINKYSA